METTKTVVATKWSVDQAHSTIEFKVRHLMISHIKGSFKTFDASIYTTGRDFSTAEVDLWIDVASISTGDEIRDKHLLGADFFDVENHKQISFTSNTIGKADGDGNHELWGVLTMRGIAQDIKLNVLEGGIIKDPWGNERAGFTVTAVIKRSDWGIIFNSTLDSGEIMIGDDVNITCDLEVVNKGPKEAAVGL